ncbi:fungal-specific transcription factor domain-containing protein [Scheffersomyces amazonensis]|uniref:fungal-specific transcription factor domain-containing protein n=1 Tax=Scheffersomyces amazonensis TaxID=1078765 RepID=UPI00315D17E8
MTDSETPPPTKKRRVKQACDFCRSKKAKCDGQTPTCSTCISNHETCTYTQSTKRRGLPTGYTHDLEKKVILFQALMTSLITDFPDLNKVIEAKLLSIMTDGLESEKFLENINNLQVLWDSHSVSEMFDQFIVDNNSAIHEAKRSTTGLMSLSSLQNSISQQSEMSSTALDIPQVQSFNNNNHNNNNNNNSSSIVFHGTHGVDSQDYNLISDPAFFLNDDIFQFIAEEFDGNTENWEPVALQYHGLSSIISGFTSKAIQQYNNRLLIDQKNPFRVGSIFNISSSAISASISNTIKLPSEIFQFPDNLRKIVDCYFQIYHPWLPMLDRISIIRQTHHLQSFNGTGDKSKLKASDCNMIALIWAILALGKLGSSSSASNTVNNNKLTASYAKNAIMALENSFTTTIETIQAMVLLGLYYYQLGQWDYSWVLISSGSRMAIDVRMMAPAPHSDDYSKRSKPASPLDKINRERTWASVYIINTLLASRMGRSPVVRSMDWPVPQINSDGWEEWESWKCYHSPETISMDSGRFLSSFNEGIKVISILNVALTCTIDTTRGMLAEDSEIKQEDYIEDESLETKGNKRTLFYFKTVLDEWFSELPSYCKLDAYENSSAVPPTVAFLNLCRDITWCVLAARLSALKSSSDGDTVKDRIIKSRNRQYTKAILSIKKIINVHSLKNLKYYPFIDYFILMGFNFPNMMDFGGENADTLKSTHCEDFRSFLVNAALTSIPCRISWEIYKVMNDIVDDLLATMTNEAMKRKEPILPPKNDSLRYQINHGGQNTSSPFSGIFNHLKQSSNSTHNLATILNTPSTIDNKDSVNSEVSKISDISEKNDVNSNSTVNINSSSNHNFSIGPMFGINSGLSPLNQLDTSTSKFASTSNNQSPPREELDLFMLDTDFARNDTRLDKFMRNLGYIHNDSNERSAIDSKKSVRISTNKPSIPSSIEIKVNNGNNDIENIGLHEYLQKLAGKSNQQ